jgi:hypothetical protein
MSDSTSIESLSSNNISLTTTEKQQPVQNNNKGNIDQQEPSKMINGITELSSKTINEIVSGIRNASQKGLTSLISRDIPTTTPHITQDEEIKPNYIPEPTKKDYIEQHDTYQDLIERNQKSTKQEEKIENIYEEVQNPLVATILFFFFQMPYFSNIMKHYIPALFNTSGTPTLIGHLYKASLFGFGFYGITKISNYLSEM